MNRIIPLLLCLCGFIYAADEIVNTKDAGYKFKLVEDFRFGGPDEEDDNLFWVDPNTKIFPGKNGEMFIVDISNSQILVFDKEGQFLRQASRKGSGPGELRTIVSACQSAKGTIYVMDLDVAALGGAPRIIRFNNDMTYRDTISGHKLGAIPTLVVPSPDDRYLAGVYAKIDMGKGTNHLITAVIDLEAGKLLKEFYSFNIGFPDFSKVNEPSMWENYLSRQFKILYNFGMTTWSPDGKLYAANSSKYKIQRWSVGQEEADFSFERKFKPSVFGEKEKEGFLDLVWENTPTQMRQLVNRPLLGRAMEKADLPPLKAPLTALIPLEDKGIIAVTDVDTEARVNRADIFSPEGKLLTSFTVKDFGLFAITGSNPTPRMTFKDGYGYAIQTTEDGDNYAVRYKYSLEK